MLVVCVNPTRRVGKEPLLDGYSLICAIISIIGTEIGKILSVQSV